MTLTQEIIYQAWHKRNALFYWVLVPLSWVFALISLLRRYAYRLGLLKTHSLPVPVIIIGNIHMGGSGKTPVVIWMVEQLREQGYEPAVISRGYGGTAKLPTPVYASSNPRLVGDEPVLIANRCNCPIFVGANRVHVGLELLKAHPSCNVIISDDGLQHYRLKRDMEIAVIDAETYLKNACLLPAGSLREPMGRLQKVDAIIKNGQENTEDEHSVSVTDAYQMQLIGTQFYNLVDPDIKATAVYFKRKSIKAIAGIGNPARFYEHLRHLGLNFSSTSFEDHHAFTTADFAQLECDVLLMTEKDAVKCKPFAQAHHWVLPIEAKIDGDLMQLVLKKLQNRTY
ncbi:MAG: tetraacyldisaccharide 4'-kinase [Proteobacteria bacterium ST_bin12]|nr:MAG: tetraacyldisaccharide 4'-kinase [Proteobacteria bacterium ST_bin12]